ncbi:putative cell division topological specificity factor MinE [Trichostrongylus colubriformis]|uniref:Cell division topological specificity factor MinE n=1 Tax=Trichostrongylus colubriformis TaxID=6319 RepID=A0AAN8FVB7_TRICO
MPPPSESCEDSDFSEQSGQPKDSTRAKQRSVSDTRGREADPSRSNMTDSDEGSESEDQGTDAPGIAESRFEIPERDEDLLSNSINTFIVSKDSITLETALKVVENFESAVDDGDYGAIYTYFDDLFNICRIETTIRNWNVWLDLIQTLIKAFNAFKPDLVKTLCYAVSAGESLPENLAEVCADRVEVLQMLVYLIQRLTFHIEGAVIKRAYSDLGVEIDGNEVEFNEEGDTFNTDLALWKELRSQIADMIGFICCINIPRGNGESVENAIKFLWRPAEANIQLLRALTSIIIKFVAHPRFAKGSTAELRQLFEHLRPICVDFKLAFEVARILVKASTHFEYLNDPRITDYPFVEPLKKLSIDGDMDQMMSHMLYFVGMLRPREASVQSVSKPFALIIQKIAQIAPLTFFENIRGVLPFLDFDPPAMRSAILVAFCKVICGPDMKPHFLRPGRDARIVRDIMADQLQAHLADSNLQVRTQALNCWVLIAHDRRVPINSLKKGLVYAVAERLNDKSVNTRMVAMQFLVLYLLRNPYGMKLDFESLSLTCEKLNEYKERIKLIDPDRPGFFVVMDRFKSIEAKMRALLESIIESKAYEKDSEGIEDEPFESVMALLVDMVEISMRDTLCVLVKLLHLGRFENIDVNLPRKDLIDALVREFEKSYVSVHVRRIGTSFDEELLQSMEHAYEENMDYVEHALRVTQEKMVFAEQMTLVFPILADSLKQNGFTDVSYAVTFCATCERFGIRNAACALYDLYNLGNATLSAEVLNTVMALYIKKKDRNSKSEVDVVGTANALITRLTKQDQRDIHAITELFYHMFRRYKIPPALISHLIKIINEVQPTFCKYPAMVVLALFARVDPVIMREYLRDFQRCLRSSEVLVASEALRAMSYLIPSQEGAPDEENEAYRYRLRAIDSLFPDIEKFLFRVILSDDDTMESKYWYVSMRHCMKTLLTLSSDVDYAVSRILGKALWYAHRAAQLLIMYREEPPKELSCDFVKARKEYFNIAWQRTTERVLMLFGDAVECLLVYVDSYFPRLLKRAMALDEAAAEQLDEPTEPYADYDKPHSDVEMDFAYREGLFARTIASVAKSKADGADSVMSEVDSERSDRPSASEEDNDDDDDDGNRPSTEELIRTRTQALFQTRLLHKTGVIGRCLALVVFFIRCQGIPDEIRNAALRAFSKFLLICPQLTERASPTFFTFICCHPDPQMKEYLLAAGVDVMYRFPAMLESHSLFLFEMPMDADPNVRITSLLYLTYLLTHDVLKPRGTLSDTALCMLNRKRSDGKEEDCTNDEREVSVLATELFRQISRKGNLLVNVLPDLICRICRWEEQVPLTAFKYLVKRLLPMVDDKPLDVVIEKMCQRFEFCNRREATEHNRHIAYYFSYFISQLTLTDSSFYKMRDSLPYFAPFLEDEIVYRDFMAVISRLISSTSSGDVKRDAEELLRKMEFLHVKSGLTEEERDRMSKAVGPINLDVPVKLDKEGNPIMFTFADCDEPIEYDNS